MNRSFAIAIRLIPSVLLSTVLTAACDDGDDGSTLDAGMASDVGPAADVRALADAAAPDGPASSGPQPDGGTADSQSETGYTAQQKAFCSSACVQREKAVLLGCLAGVAGMCTQSTSFTSTNSCYATGVRSRLLGFDNGQDYFVSKPNGDTCVSVTDYGDDILVDTLPESDVTPMAFRTNGNNTVILSCGRDDAESDSELFPKGETICGIPYAKLIPATNTCMQGECEALSWP